MTFWKVLISNKGEDFKDIVFGFQDGLISTYVLLVAIAFLVYTNPYLLLIALMAELIAGSLSMGFGAYVSTKTKNQYILQEKKLKQELVRDERLFEKYYEKEMLLDEEELELAKKISKKYPNFWFKLNDTENLLQTIREPPYCAFKMSIAFIVGAILPILPYIVPTPIISFTLASIFSFSALFMVGILKSQYNEKHWLYGGLEMVLIGLVATIIISTLTEVLIVGFELVILQERFT
jgi:VIT1/CCC1 family predicted Fe2+/Mn2+ transporter